MLKDLCIQQNFLMVVSPYSPPLFELKIPLGYPNQYRLYTPVTRPVMLQYFSCIQILGRQDLLEKENKIIFFFILKQKSTRRSKSSLYSKIEMQTNRAALEQFDSEALSSTRAQSTSNLNRVLTDQVDVASRSS